MDRRAWYAVFVVILLGLAGCSTVSYYGQAVCGHVSLILRSNSIERLLQDQRVDVQTAERLALVLKIRNFATDTLALPDNSSYTRYTHLDRNYAVWAVFATPEFSIEPVTWCFPVAGCVAYRGYFDRQRAEAFGLELGASGLDIFSGPVAAYSTLGWWPDPVLNTIVERPDADLAGLIFHELAHQVVYVKDDTAFNESFATFVEEKGVAQWLAAVGDRGALARYRVQRRWQHRVVEMITRQREVLARLYESDLSPEALRKGKIHHFGQLRILYHSEKIAGGHPSTWDHWMFGPPNNARLNAIATYHHYLPAFESLFEASDSNFPAFFEAVRKLAHRPPAERLRALSRLMAT